MMVTRRAEGSSAGRHGTGGVRLLLCASVAFLAWAAPAAARQPGDQPCLRGQVVDASTGAPIAGAVVQREHGEGAVRTGAQGHFTLCLGAGTHRLVVSVVGYILVKRTVRVGDADVELVIPLAAGTGTYTEQVSVTAAADEPTVSAVPGRQSLGSAELQDLRGVLADDPFRAVQSLPGVAANDDLRSEFSVRGSSFRQLGVVVDGVPTPALLHGVGGRYEDSGSVAMVNSDILERVDLLFGSYAQRYGNHTGAELSFETREGSRARVHSRFAVSGTNASAVLEGPVGRTGRGSWLISARKSYLDGLISRIVEDDDFSFGFTDAHMKLGWDLGARQHVQASLVVGRSGVDRERENLGLGELARGTADSFVGSVRWRLAPRPDLLLTSTVAAVGSDFRNRNREALEIESGSSTEASWRADVAWTGWRAWRVEGGAALQQVQAEARERHYGPAAGGFVTVNTIDWSGLQPSAWGQARVESRRGASLTAGARVDGWAALEGADVSPWLQAAWPLTETLHLRAGTGVYRQPPGFEAIDGMRAGRDLVAERAWHVDAALGQALPGGMRWEIVAYARAERDILRLPLSEPQRIGDVVVPESTWTDWENALDGAAGGAEFLVGHRTPNGLSGWVSYAYGRAQYTDDRRNETFWADQDQRHTANVYLHYRLSDRTSVSLKLRAGSNYPIPGYLETRGDEYHVSDARNRLRLPAYHRLDLRANRTFRIGSARLTLFAELLNAYGRDNLRAGDYDYRPGGRVMNVTETMVPFLPSAGMLVEF